MIGFLRILPLMFLGVAPLAAQAPDRTPERAPERAPERTPERASVPGAVPREMLPPAGKCRIWMEGVAPAQQPAPTDCQTALRQRPSNGIVVFGPAAGDPPMNNFARPRAARDTTREARPQQARPANAPPPSRSDSATSRRRRPE
jgi:hypothetical protein